MFQVKEPLSDELLEALIRDNTAMKREKTLVSVQSKDVAYCRLDGRVNRLRIGLKRSYLRFSRPGLLLETQSTNDLEFSLNVPDDASWYFPIVKVRLDLSESDCELVIKLRTKQERELFIGKLNRNKELKK